MARAWTVRDTSGVKVISLVRGEEKISRYPETTTLGAVVTAELEKHDLGSVLMQDLDGEEIDPSDSNKTLAEIGEVTLVPKTVGA